MTNLSDQTRKDQVLAKLRTRPGEWFDGAALANEECGGSEGLKRLRELRADGWLIQSRRKPTQGSDQFQYRIAVQLRTDGTLGYYDPTLHPEDHPQKERVQAETAAPSSPAPQQPSGGFWGSHETDRRTDRKSWHEWKTAKKAPGTLECVFWIGKQRVIGAIGDIGNGRWAWGVLIPGSTKRMTREVRAGHGVQPNKNDARDAVEDCVSKLREKGVLR